MKHLIHSILALCLVFSHTVFSADTHAVKSDNLKTRLQNELDGFYKAIQENTGSSLIVTADKISGAGLDDDKLFKLVDKKLNELLKQHLATPKNNEISLQINALLRSYVSSGKKESLIWADRLLNESKSRGVRNRALRIKNKLSWYQQRNAIMQNPEYYAPSQELMTHRFLNLLNSEDLPLARWGAEEIGRNGGSEAVVFDHMRAYVDSNARKTLTNLELDLIAWYCKTLKKFDLEKSKALLQGLSGDKSVHKKIRKYARI